LTEPDVTLTDYGLGVLCGALAVALYRGEPPGALRSWFALLFTSAAAAPFFGGTVHGFFLDESSLGHRFLWPATLIATGVSTLCAWAIGAHLVLPQWTRSIVGLAALQLLLFSWVVVYVDQRFALAVANYAPAVLFLSAATLWALRQQRSSGLGTMACGLGLTFVAAAIQQLAIAVHPIYFDHNALYHVVQAVAMVLVFLGARALTENSTAGIQTQATR